MREGEDHRVAAPGSRGPTGSSTGLQHSMWEGACERIWLSSAEPGGQSWDDHSHLRTSAGPDWGWAKPLTGAGTSGGRCYTKRRLQRTPKDWTWGEPKSISKKTRPLHQGSAEGRSPAARLPKNSPGWRERRSAGSSGPSDSVSIPILPPHRGRSTNSFEDRDKPVESWGSVTLLVKLCSPCLL